MNIHIKVTVTNDTQKLTLSFINVSEKISSGKNHNFLVTSPSQQHLPTKYFTRETHFFKEKLKSSYR